MWYRMACLQRNLDLSDRLIRAITNWKTFGCYNDEVRELIDEEGADVNQQFGTLIPIACACMVEDDECLRLLLVRGANINAKDGYGRAALHYAAERESDCLAVLIEHKANPNIRDNNNDTPLHWAAFRNQIENAEILLQNGANVNALDYHLDSPLSWAASRGHYDLVRLFIRYNANYELRNKTGHRPLDRCYRLNSYALNDKESDKCLDLLLEVTVSRMGSSTTGSFEEIQSSPPSLKSLTRHIICTCFPSTVDLITYTKLLPLPKSLQTYLSYSEVLDQPV